MPRPKRTKVASTASRVAKPSKAAQVPATQQQSISRKPIAPRAVGATSEDSDGLVFKATRARRKAPPVNPQEDVEHIMTGALPVTSENDMPGDSSKNRTPASHASRRTKQAISGTPESSQRRSTKMGQTSQSRSLRKDSSHMATEEGDSSSFGDHLLSFTSLGSDSPAHGTRPPSAIKIGATPAHERSILALTNFKRRARQPSLLRMVHQTTDVEDNDLDDLQLSDLEDCELLKCTYSDGALADTIGISPSKC